ncbi:MAG: phytanoyl-CoA dioxygenase family protein, partial [Alphaproteobacteria bacterium]|nr:phytanoyl-CoA dioxygenase family protein [Alphaproteobacteria bacterium]
MHPLNPAQHETYQTLGHLTVANVYGADEMDGAIADAEDWARHEIERLDQAERAWYLDGGVKDRAVLRKLDNPVYWRPAFRALAASETLLALVTDIIGPAPRVFFSQFFFKAPGGGGPKPVHQDNFYFGPNDLDGMVTAWIALDDADAGNGCLFYGDGSNLGPVIAHVAPEGQPFNLRLPDDVPRRIPLTAAPAPPGGTPFLQPRPRPQSSANPPDARRRRLP